MLTVAISLGWISETASAEQDNDLVGADSPEAGTVFFEKHVRPVLVERCVGCHGPEIQEAGLRVDSLANLLQGGERGPAIVPGSSANSLLVQAIRHENELVMPPDEALPTAEIAGISQWIDEGAFWPADHAHENPSAIAEAAKSHWAFQSPIRVEPPGPIDPWVRTPVDAFVLARLRENGFSPSKDADRRTLIRRLSYTLTGLPPGAGQVKAFVEDPDPLAWEKLVDRFLDSPGYGEHWARHWLDIARYSDTKGYVYAREERFWTHAWAYRDWVVQAINNDMPYDRFLLMQIAADQVPDRMTGDLAAMGFLTLGRRFLGVRRDIIDDQIDVVSRGTMGLTVSCARCHDHKYDPIPTADYYSLYGVFDSCVEEQTILSEDFGDGAFREECQKRQAMLVDTLARRVRESESRIRQRVADYLFAQSELQKYPAEGFDQLFQKSDLLPVVVRSWSRFLRAAEIADDSVFAVWRRCAAIPADSFAEQAAVAIDAYRQSGQANSLIVKGFETVPTTFRECCDRYGVVFADVDRQWLEALESAVAENRSAPTNLPDPAAEEIRKVLYGDVLHGTPGPCRIPGGPISLSEFHFDTDTINELWKLQGEVDRWLINGPNDVEIAVILKDQPVAVEPRVFLRGNPMKPGDDVERHFLSLFGPATVFQNGSGRLELARAIIDPENPLTARVLVNRVWSHHFGNGLVSTESDFGLRAEKPSHPELLDWLATGFVEQGWSLKQLHRTILLSSTFRQASIPGPDSQSWQQARLADPENRLLWRMNDRRLSFEELRDSMLQATGDIDRRMGGRPADLFVQPFSHRRTLYGLVDRQFFSSTLRVFDFANPDLHISKRNETTVPQQALFFLNHPLVLEQARELARLNRDDNDPVLGVAQIYQKVFHRDPGPEELADALALLQQCNVSQPEPVPSTVNDWSFGLGEFNESENRVSGFELLPYFADGNWQGGSVWPDPALGWVQLTSTGGHPGNTRSHAAVRRWTAPADMTVSIRSKWVHQPEQGDGVRVFLVSSANGLLQSAKIHASSAEMNVDSLPLKKGETIDFVVDIDQVLNSDQYQCSIDLEEAVEPGGKSTCWNSERDFPRDKTKTLDGWEQLAQILFCTNEFLFVD